MSSERKKGETGELGLSPLSSSVLPILPVPPETVASLWTEGLLPLEP